MNNLAAIKLVEDLLRKLDNIKALTKNNGYETHQAHYRALYELNVLKRRLKEDAEEKTLSQN